MMNAKLVGLESREATMRARGNWAKLKIAAVGLLIMLLAACSSNSEIAPPEPGDVQFGADKEAALLGGESLVDGMTVSEDFYVFIPANEHIEEVTFQLDRDDEGAITKTEPDYGILVPVTTLPAGDNTLFVTIRLNNDTVVAPFFTFIVESQDTPTDPEDPGDPEDPIDPEDPGDPEDPTDPEDPVDPVDPNEPGPSLPEPWQSRDIGNPLSGSASYSDDTATFHIEGAGDDIWNGADSFHFVYQELEGNGEIIARITSIDNTHSFAKAGVMIRESLADDAANAMVHLSPEGVGVSFQWRSSPGSTTDSVRGAFVSAPYWVKLSREGNVFRAYESADGENWTLVGTQTINMEEQVYVGLAVTSHDSSKITTAIFDNVSLAHGVSQTTSPEEPDEPAPALDEADYYVATNGSDANPGTLEEPFATVIKALLLVSPGDVIQLRGGVYNQILDTASNEYNGVASGTRDKPIIIESYPGEMAIFDGSGYTGWALFRIDNLDWYVIRDLTFRNSPGKGLTVQGDHNVIRNVLSYDNGGDGIYVLGDYALIEEVVSHGNYHVGSGGNGGDGIKFGSGDNGIIRNCLVYNNSDDGLDIINSSNTLVEYCVSHDNGYGRRGNGNGFKLGGHEKNHHNIGRYLIAYNNRAVNFDYSGGGGITVINSVSWNAGSMGFAMTTSGTPNVAINNISYQDPQSVSRGSRGRDDQNNSWNFGIRNPNFVSTDPDSSKLLMLESNSPAIDRGRDVGLPYRGDAPDLGALEYGENIADLLASDSAEQAFPFSEIEIPFTAVEMAAAF